MDELSLYEKILNLSAPWFVEGVTFYEPTKSVTVHVAVDKHEALRCPKCKAKCPGYDQLRTGLVLRYCLFVILAYNGVQLPITDTCALLDNRWTFINGHLVDQFSSVIVGAIALASLLLTA